MADQDTEPYTALTYADLLADRDHWRDRAQTAEKRVADIWRGIQSEIDDLDYDGRMRRIQDDPDAQGDPGIAGNAYWRAYCRLSAFRIAMQYITGKDD
ncbi:hypothetical protein [Allonocardiopsis opalescens]|uniref:Uncharacterized protein n=1 Tax=Allonocardiopsis opalescens TaxID=1144618 RepID=A0A2T0PSS0_9ACTN|nr:hypothetical protein [Allonocardiopsis opalescens]PRX91935.1 hypothetical protein CLV72_1128 [Allonocardiopsis opalescens]